ncbi:uncharacterized protein [Battus philenor]|uniref:uncharacterized protein n=1 Tax=Battus philenor TaxID=42288 RepID=UPI0035CF92FC
MEKDPRSVIINISKQREYLKQGKSAYVKHFVCGIPKTDRRRVINKPSESTLKVYTLPEDKPLPIFKLKNDVMMLSYKFYSKIQNVRRYKKRLAIPISDKHKIISTDFRQRLYVNYCPEKINTVLDIDEDFYRCVNGSTFAHTHMQYKLFKMYLNRRLRINQQIGQVRDCSMNIEENQKKEMEIYNKTLSKVTEQAKYFDQFISEDYSQSMILLDKGDKLISEVDKINSELESLASEKFFITSKLIGLDYRYSLQQKYGRFLYYLSPPSWRAKNRDFARSIEIEAKGFDLGISSEEDTFTVIYEKMRKECCSKLVKPALYFTEPKHLMHVFESIEKHQLNHFTHVSHFSPITKILKNNIESLKDDIAHESVNISGTVTYFKSLVEFSEQRSKFLKELFFKVLHGLFFESVGALDVLKLFLHLDFCYEKVYNEKPINKDIRAVAAALEIFYTEYTKKLDALHSDTVRHAINICLDAERQKNKNAVEAAKELRLYYRLEKELLRAYGLQSKIDSLSLPGNRNTNKMSFTIQQNNINTKKSFSVHKKRSL